jgi:hypothetical protein
LQRKFLTKKDFFLPNRFSKNQPQHTIRYSLSNQGVFFTDTVKTFYKKFFAPRKPKYYDVDEKIKKIRAMRRGPDYTKNFNLELYDLLVQPTLIDRRLIGRLITQLCRKPKYSFFLTKRITFIFDINFLRKEKIYTKLKYSRVPQYDLVSGGAAAIFAGFLGFLITEKFGLELLDSGDF